MTKEELWKQSKEAMEKTEFYGGDMELDGKIRVGVGEYSQSMDLYGDLELKVTPDIVYIGENIGSETAFLLLPVEMSENGESSTVYMNIANEWQKNEAEQSAESERNADLTEAMQDCINQYSDNLQLSEEMGEVEGEKTYILTGTLEGSTIQELFDLIMGETADAKADLEESGIGLDFSAMNFGIELQYFEKEQDSMYSTLEYSVEVFDAFSTESELEERVPLYVSYLEENAKTGEGMYQDIKLSERKEKEVGGQTVKYQYITYLAQGVPYCWGNAWVVSGNGFYALLADCYLTGEDDAGSEDWVEDAFAGVTVVNYLTNLVSAI